MSKAKKVIFVIVEGPTDKDALSSVLKQIFSSAEVHFHVIRGDITTEDGEKIYVIAQDDNGKLCAKSMSNIIHSV